MAADVSESLPWLAVPTPRRRRLKVYSIDPSAGSYVGNEMTLSVPWEPLAPGPTGRRIAVVDYDAVNDRYYSPVDLDDPLLLTNDGLAPSESDPRFHQQMVYAVASQMLDRFESALGRRIHWRRGERTPEEEDAGHRHRSPDDTTTLLLYPHAIEQANAFYSADAHGIVFGHFRADRSGQGDNLPGQRVFTCLSHDIVAHEVTHAVVDGLRSYFTEATNPDVLAFHEGFADVAALFSHFAQRESLVDEIRRTGGRLYSPQLSSSARSFGEDGTSDPSITGEVRQSNPLVGLAMQFGQASGAGHVLRSALGTPPDSDAINRDIDDPHARGSILVAAIFDAYFSVYVAQTAPLFEIFHARGPAMKGESLPGILSERLADIAAELADRFFTLCARAIDYCPPMDLTFGDYLRALVTTVVELDPDDCSDLRAALMESFRSRGIYSESASFYSVDALVWPRASMAPIGPQRIKHPTSNRSAEMGLVFGGPNGLTSFERDVNGRVLRSWAAASASELDLDPDLPVTVPSFHTVHRSLEDGSVRADLIVEVVQTRTVHLDPDVPDAGSLPIRGGATVIISAPELSEQDGQIIALDPEVRFVIGRPMAGRDGDERTERHRHVARSRGPGLSTGDGADRIRANFADIHRVVR